MSHITSVKGADTRGWATVAWSFTVRNERTTLYLWQHYMGKPFSYPGKGAG